MSWDYFISGILANLIIEHREKKKQQKTTSAELAESTRNITPVGRYCEDMLNPEPETIKAPDISWRIKYQDNKADISPEWYDTEKEFLAVYEDMLAVMCKEFMKAVRSDLMRFSEDRDLRLAAAMVYISYRGLKPNYYDCAMKCLGDIMKRNGIDMETVISVAEQLDEAIEFCDKNPDSDREFQISLL